VLSIETSSTVTGTWPEIEGVPEIAALAVCVSDWPVLVEATALKTDSWPTVAAEGTLTAKFAEQEAIPAQLTDEGLTCQFRLLESRIELIVCPAEPVATTVAVKLEPGVIVEGMPVTEIPCVVVDDVVETVVVAV